MSRTHRSVDEARRRGLSRVAPVTAGIVLAGGVMSVSTAVALAATRDTPATTGTPRGTGSTTAPTGRDTVQLPSLPSRDQHRRHRDGPPAPPDGGGGIAPGGDAPPQGQSQGS